MESELPAELAEVDIESLLTASQQVLRLEEALERWSRDGGEDYKNGEAICLETRESWAAYYDEWLAGESTGELTHGLLVALKRAVVGLEPKEGKEEAWRKTFCESVQFRLELTELLQESHGLDQVRKAIEERRRIEEGRRQSGS